MQFFSTLSSRRYVSTARRVSENRKFQVRAPPSPAPGPSLSDRARFNGRVYPAARIFPLSAVEAREPYYYLRKLIRIRRLFPRHVFAAIERVGGSLVIDDRLGQTVAIAASWE